MSFGLRSKGRQRVAVVSPHLDDGILSLGASIADAVRAGSDIAIVTVFAGDPESAEPAGRWDRRTGFRTAGDAARSRRDEDRVACASVGAEPVWRPFADGDYGRERNADHVWEGLVRELAHFDAALVPGRPLIQPDHLWLARLVSERGLRRHLPLGVYAELPYDRWAIADKRRQAPASTPEVLGTWVAPRVTVRSRLTKWRASAAYSSQLPWLGRGSQYRRALLQSRLGCERVAWQLT